MTGTAALSLIPPNDRQVGPVAEHRFRAMNTDVHLIVVGGPSDLPALAEEAIRAREARWSRFLPDSDLSRINRAPGRPVVVAPDTFTLVAAAIDAHRLTGGAFDPTVLACLEAAGYDRSFEHLPAAGSGFRSGSGTGPERRPAAGHGRGGDSRAARPGSGPEPTPHPRTPPPAPGPDGIELHTAISAVVIPPGVGLDLGGIAKGAAADAVAAELLAAGAAGCCVNIGGDLRVAGLAPTAVGWVVDLACPGAATAGAVRTITLADGAVCTSAVGRRRWRGPDGRTQHHLRHPATGAPIDNGLAAVSIVAATATQAEVLTKVAFGAGAGAAADRLAPYGVTGVLVFDNGDIVALPGLPAFALDGSLIGTGTEPPAP